MGRLSTWFSTGKKPSVDESTTFLEDLHKLRLRVKRLEIGEEELLAKQDSLLKQIQTLRGMATGGIRRGQESSLDSIQTKDELREYARQRGLFNIRRGD